MAQYREIRTGYPQEFASGGCEFRYRAEGGILYIEELVGTWQTIDTLNLPGITRNVFRIGTRGGYFVYHQEITVDGFDGGTIGVNWDNIEQHSLAAPTTSTTSTSSTSTSSTSTSSTSSSSTTSTTSTTTEGPSPYGIYLCYYFNPINGEVYVRFGTTTFPTGSPVIIDVTSIPDTGDFSLSGVASSPTVSLVELLAQEGYTELKLTFSDNIVDSDTPLLTYTKGATPLLDLSGLELDGWINEPVVDFI